MPAARIECTSFIWQPADEDNVVDADYTVDEEK